MKLYRSLLNIDNSKKNLITKPSISGLDEHYFPERRKKRGGGDMSVYTDRMYEHCQHFRKEQMHLRLLYYLNWKFTFFMQVWMYAINKQIQKQRN